jgi:hypothetical protein
MCGRFICIANGSSVFFLPPASSFPDSVRVLTSRQTFCPPRAATFLSMIWLGRLRVLGRRLHVGGGDCDRGRERDQSDGDEQESGHDCILRLYASHSTIKPSA